MAPLGDTRMQRLVRTVLAVALAVAGLSAAGIASGHGLDSALGGGCAAADGMHHATLVVTHSDAQPFNGRSLRFCDSFSGDSISGEKVLDDSGYEKATQQYGSYGDAACQVDNEPAQYSNCFGTSQYWAIFVSVAGGGGQWASSSSGMTNLTLHDGDAIGFRYDSQSGTAAAPVSPTGTCPLPTAAPTAAPTSSPAAPHPTPSQSSPARTAGSSAAPSPASPATTTAGATPAASAAAATPSSASSSPAVAALATSGPTAGGKPGSPLAPLLAGSLGAVLVALLGARILQLRRR